jgi:hypothetical protein
MPDSRADARPLAIRAFGLRLRASVVLAPLLASYAVGVARLGLSVRTFLFSFFFKERERRERE